MLLTLKLQLRREMVSGKGRNVEQEKERRW